LIFDFNHKVQFIEYDVSASIVSASIFTCSAEALNISSNSQAFASAICC